MHQPLGFSEIHEVENLSKKLKTIPKQEIQELEQLKEDPKDEATIGDFVAPPPALSAKQLYKDEMSEPKIQESMQSDPSISVYNKINSNDWSDYKQYIPSYNNTSESNTDDYLSKKINYMIHLLEEQRSEKTSYVTEELILYMFLGVFVIFVVDSFARAGKYTR